MAAHTMDLLEGLVIPADDEARQREEEERDRVLDAMEAEQLRADLLERLRAEMVRLFNRREKAAPGHGYVCADDARKVLESWEDVPPPDVLSRNFMGALFRPPCWTTSGDMVPSATKGAHGRRILAWRYAPQAGGTE